MPKTAHAKKTHPAQKQYRQPGIESEMKPIPESKPEPKRVGKLQDKVAIITGGDSGIGRAVAALFAQEGADVCIMYLNEHSDARMTSQTVEKYGRTSLLISGDIGSENFCKEAVKDVITKFGKVDILVNNAAEQYPQKDIQDITKEQLEKTFSTNIFSQFYMTQAVVPNMKEGSVIINTSSVTAYRGSSHLLDYSATKGAIISFTRSLSEALISKGIRVNGVAPGAVWTPLIVSTFSAEEVKNFGTDNPMGRAAEPNEIAPSYLFLASSDSSFMTGQVLHPNGGEIING
ncbi:MAG: SDR family oxidoreductase [bacterium]|nr:SDR family oxidoreductase [bacterium]